MNFLNEFMERFYGKFVGKYGSFYETNDNYPY